MSWKPQFTVRLMSKRSVVISAVSFNVDAPHTLPQLHGLLLFTV